ncbi:hypothetical protein [Streptococcus pluranimalium]|uniref:hypothetical protein n=1 Tax=Streptococcus pluranimalium TaxID=82348 RepID=UPI0031388EC0
MLSREYLELYLKKAHFTSLKHLLFRIMVNSSYPDDMYFSSRVRITITHLINEIRKREAVKGHSGVAELYQMIEEVVERELG